MAFFRVTPARGAPCLRQAPNLSQANARGLREWPAGLRSVEPLGARELVDLESRGFPLPLAARRLLAAYRARQREQLRKTAKRDAARMKAWEEAARAKDEDRARREALKAQQKAEREAEKRREKLHQAREARKLQQEAVVVAVQAVPQGGVEVPPWEA